MPFCRCHEKCNYNIEAGAPYVEVKQFGYPTQPVPVALHHLTNITLEEKVEETARDAAKKALNTLVGE